MKIKSYIGHFDKDAIKKMAVNSFSDVFDVEERGDSLYLIRRGYSADQMIGRKDLKTNLTMLIQHIELKFLHLEIQVFVKFNLWKYFFLIPAVLIFVLSSLLVLMGQRKFGWTDFYFIILTLMTFFAVRLMIISNVEDILGDKFIES